VPRSGRVAHSRRSFALPAMASPLGLPYTRPRGGPVPRSGRVAHSRRSFALPATASPLVTQVVPVQVIWPGLARSTRAPGFARFVSWPFARSTDFQTIVDGRGGNEPSTPK
jgi:hypothetical protein